jgi:hypothetical protein
VVLLRRAMFIVLAMLLVRMGFPVGELVIPDISPENLSDWQFLFVDAGFVPRLGHGAWKKAGINPASTFLPCFVSGRNDDQGPQERHLC